MQSIYSKKSITPAGLFGFGATISESYQEVIEALAFYLRPHLGVELISIKPKCSVEHFRESWLAR